MANIEKFSFVMECNLRGEQIAIMDWFRRNVSSLCFCLGVFVFPYWNKILPITISFLRFITHCRSLWVKVHFHFLLKVSLVLLKKRFSMGKNQWIKAWCGCLIVKVIGRGHLKYYTPPSCWRNMKMENTIVFKKWFSLKRRKFSFKWLLTMWYFFCLKFYWK